MKKILPVVISSLLMACVLSTRAQTFTPFYSTPVTPRSYGFYEYLPQGYSSGTETYPLLLAIHGGGDVGNGTSSDLPKLLQVGLTKKINQGNFPSSFTVNGITKSFIVIAPQFTTFDPSTNASELQALYDWAVARYRVDLNRVYITGLSLGGGMTWEYVGSSTANADRIAAIVPVAGASFPQQSFANTIAASGLPVWATHNSGDPVIPSSYTDNWVSMINSASPSVPAKKTIFTSNSHDAWSQTYDASYTEGGLNVFQWMLQFQRSIVSLPVTLSKYAVNRISESEVVLSWTTATEKDNSYFTIERSGDGSRFNEIGRVRARAEAGDYSFTDVHPLPGDNYYRLTQTDANGKKTQFGILRMSMSVSKPLVLYPNPAQGSVTVQLTGDAKGKASVELINASGLTLANWNDTKSGYTWTRQFPLSGIASGSYFLRVTCGSTTTTEPLVIR